MINNAPTSFSLSEELEPFFALLRRRKHSVLIFLFVTLFVVGAGTLLQKRVYQATASISIDMETPSLLAIYNSRDDATMAQSNYLTYADYYRTQLEILKSRRIASIAFENLGLGKLPRYANSPDPVKELMEQLTVEPVKQTRLVLLRVDDFSPKQAAIIANEIAQVFVKENLLRTTRAEAMNLMKNEYLTLQSKEAELSKRYKPKFPARLRVHNQMEQLALAIQKETGSSSQSNASEADKKKAADAPSEALAGSIDVQRLRPNNIWIQTPAHSPRKPIKPSKVLNMLLGLIFGVVGGLALAAFEEFLDPTIKTSQDVKTVIPHVFLGVVPDMEQEEAFEKGKTGIPKLDAVKRYQHMRLAGDSATSEAYRLVRTNLMYIPREKDMAAILITSPGSEEGKTTTACNLAIGLAQMGTSVLLVDADLRKPSVYRALELKQSPGLSEVLTGQVSFDKALQLTQVPGLSVITSGAIPRNPSELLGSPKMKEFHAHAIAHFDYVLIDTAPTVPVTDAAILATMTRRILAVVQSGKTPRQAFQRMLNVCEEAKAKVLGVVLNSVPHEDLTGYGYGYHIYKYGKPSAGQRKKSFSLSRVVLALFEKGKQILSKLSGGGKH